MWLWNILHPLSIWTAYGKGKSWICRSRTSTNTFIFTHIIWGSAFCYSIATPVLGTCPVCITTQIFKFFLWQPSVQDQIISLSGACGVMMNSSKCCFFRRSQWEKRSHPLSSCLVVRPVLWNGDLVLLSNFASYRIFFFRGKAIMFLYQNNAMLCQILLHFFRE